ncbi:MAG: hypothetical protein ACRD0K_27935, partial [Egibacteraceae bacterium]
MLPGAGPSYEQAAMGALLAVRPGRANGKRGVLVAARSAARLWGMTQARQRPVQLITPFGQHATERGQVYVIRSRTLLEADLASIGPLDLTAPERTVIDLARSAGRDEVFDVASVGVQLELLSPDRLAARVAEFRKPPGGLIWGWVLEELARQGRTDSTFERELRSMLFERGFDPHPGVYPLRVEGRLIAMLDVAFPAARVYINADGRRFHSDRRAFRMDRVRDNEITAAGWLGLDLSWDELMRAPDRFLSQLRRTLDARRDLCAGSRRNTAAIQHTTTR